MSKKFTKKDFFYKLKEIHPFSNFEVIEYNGINKSAIIRCLECGKVIEKEARKFLESLNLCCKHFYSLKQKIDFLAEKNQFLLS